MRSPIADLLTEAQALPDEQIEGFGKILGPLAEGEEDLGVIPDDCKRFFVLSQLAGKEHNILRAETQFEVEDPDKLYRLQYLRKRNELLYFMCWYSLRTQMHLHADEALGLRRDYRIVRIPSVEPRPGAGMEQLQKLGIQITLEDPDEQDD